MERTADADADEGADGRKSGIHRDTAACNHVNTHDSADAYRKSSTDENAVAYSKNARGIKTSDDAIRELPANA